MIQDLFVPSQMRGALSRRAYVLAAVTTLAIFALFWWLLSRSGLVDVKFLPSPITVIVATIDSFVNLGFGKDVVVSSLRILAGFLLAAALAIPMGLLIGTYKFTEALLEPLNDFIRYMPVVAFVPLSILWLGTGATQKMLIVFIGTYFQLVLMVAAAVSHVPREYLETYHVLGGRGFGHLHRIILPAAAPAIFDSLRVAAGWAWSYLVVAELVAADVGVGFKIMQAQRFFRTPYVMSGIVVVGVLGVVTDYLFKLGKRKLFPWSTET